jgi:TatD DNase family protein
VIDTHTHLYLPEFDQDIDGVIERAVAHGVQEFYLPAIDSSTTQAMYALEKRYPERMHLMMGLHPTSVQENFHQELDHVYQELNRRSFSAVGEIGIDLYWETKTLPWQQEAFAQQIKWAQEFDLPIVIHCRESFDEIFQVLDSVQGPIPKGIFHCFTGTLEQAQHIIGLGLSLGIGGVATFKNGKIDQFLAQIPMEHIVLETDSPYLAPVPFRGKRNESSYLYPIAQRVSGIYDCPLTQVDQVTTANAHAIFKS